MFQNTFNNDKSEFHFLPKELRAGQQEAKWVDFSLKVIGGIVAVGGGILSITAGIRQADELVAQLRANAAKK